MKKYLNEKLTHLHIHRVHSYFCFALRLLSFLILFFLLFFFFSFYNILPLPPPPPPPPPPLLSTVSSHSRRSLIRNSCQGHLLLANSDTNIVNWDILSPLRLNLFLSFSPFPLSTFLSSLSV